MHLTPTLRIKQRSSSLRHSSRHCRRYDNGTQLIRICEVLLAIHTEAVIVQENTLLWRQNEEGQCVRSTITPFLSLPGQENCHTR